MLSSGTYTRSQEQWEEATGGLDLILSEDPSSASWTEEQGKEK